MTKLLSRLWKAYLQLWIMSVAYFQSRKKALHFTWISNLFQKINNDYVHLFQSKLMKALVVIKNALTEWIKTRVLFNLKTEIVAKFLWKNIIYRFKCFESTVMNEDFENKVVTEELLNRYRIRIKLTSIYHASINEIIKKEHQLLINVLSKLIEDKIERWSQYLHTILWTNWIIIRDFIDITFFRLLYEYNTILFIEIKYSIWQIMNWNKIQSIEDLLIMQIRQL